MSQEAQTFIIGWLAGLIPSLITVFIGYRIQLKNDERKRKADVLNRRLDQVESVADSYLDLFREFSLWADGILDDSEPYDEDKLNATVEKLRFMLNSLVVIPDEELIELTTKLHSTVASQADLIQEIRSAAYSQFKDSTPLEQDTIQSLKSKQNEKVIYMMTVNVVIKRRIDFIRSSDPSNYLNG